MTFTAADVQYLLAAPNASAGYAVPGTVYNSNGLYCSTTQLNLEVPGNNFFPDLTGPQTAAQQVDYQCLFIYNSSDTVTMTGATVWMPSGSVVSDALDWAVGADAVGASPYESTSPQAASITSPYIEPSGVLSWVSPSSTISGGLFIGNINPQQVYCIWVRRTATGTAAEDASFLLYTSFGTNGT